MVKSTLFLRALGGSTALFGFITWAWCGLETDIYPSSQTSGLSYWFPVPQDLVAVIALPIAALGFLLYLYEKYQQT